MLDMMKMLSGMTGAAHADRPKMEPYNAPDFTGKSDREVLETVAGDIHYMRYLFGQVLMTAESNPMLRSFIPER